ncbi:DEAD/DEAH box helicase [Cryobacterium sp. TMS1-20-1]|uniref:DEAD/DEAH box helicase n=1 Tax=Cryobacterium sp. TMS1-20-1 TaxID=1259223 RepID=UPI001F541FED|nr:DEAD/DEAH box helicase [Cryobacterium sp. TMS1-20-1]
MSTHQVVVLEAGTGTGKSTLAPFRLMNPPPGAAYRPTDVGQIVVSEPRIIATKSVAKFVGEAMCFGHDLRECARHVGPGYPVGYQCEGIKVWDDACSLVYVTDGTMINWIVNGDLARIGTIIVDEAHERSENIENILTLLAAQLPRYPHLKVVIASATIDKNYFIRFFQTTPTVKVGHVFVEARKTIGYGVPLFSDLDFSEEVLENGFAAPDPVGEPLFLLPGWPDAPNPDEGWRSLRDITRNMMLGLRLPAPDWPQQVDQAGAAQTVAILDATTSGDVLVFMPSQRTILSTRDLINSVLEDREWGDTVDVYWLMKAAPDDQKKAALAQSPAGRRKVVVASTLAETSLTIEGIRFVIDSGLVVDEQWNPELALKLYPTQPHSQSGVRQRWGRVGRTSHGWVFPLYSLAQFSGFPRDTAAGTTKTNLEGTMLKLLAAGEDPDLLAFPADFAAEGLVRDSFASEGADRFRAEHRRAMSALRGSGAVTPDGRALTSLGFELARSRVPAEQAVALIFADRLACLPEVATALVVLQSGPLVTPSIGSRDDGLLASNPRWTDDRNAHARRCHEALADGCADDLELVVRIFSSWARSPDPGRWCRQWWINENVLRSATKAAGALMKSFAPGMDKEATRPLELALVVRARAAISRALPNLRFERAPTGLWHSTSNPDSRPVASPPLHIVAPADTVISLYREQASAWGWEVGAGTIHGLVAAVPWATDGDPDSFELVRRVRDRARQDGPPSDPTRLLRKHYPVGARLSITPSSNGAPPAITKTSDGIEMVDELPEDDDMTDGATGDSLVLVYKTETADAADTEALDLYEITDSDPFPESDPEPEIARSRKVAGKAARSTGDLAEVASAVAEIPDEEQRLLPLPLLELEHEQLEHFASAENATADTAWGTFETFDASPAMTVRGPEPDWQQPWHALVAGYLLDDGQPRLLVEMVPAQPDDWPDVGSEISVVAGELATTHYAQGRVFRAAATRGSIPPISKQFAFNSLVDDRVGADPEAITEGSIWDALVLPGRRARDPLRLSLAQAAIARLSSGPKGAGALQAVMCEILAERYRDRNGNWYALGHVIPRNDGGFAPRILIPVKKFEEASIAVLPGTRMQLNLQYDMSARRSGKWPAGILEAIAEKGSRRLQMKKKGQLWLSGPAPLTEIERDELLQLDGGNARTDRNTWMLWETSRRIAVRSTEMIAEADIPIQSATLLRGQVGKKVKRDQNVSVAVTRAGKLVVSGTAENVNAALASIRLELAAPTFAVQLPSRRGRYPAEKEVTNSLDAFDPATRSEFRYNEKRGRLAIPRNFGQREALIQHLVGPFTTWAHTMTFTDTRGFLAFQKKTTWDSVADGLTGVSRKSEIAGSVWAIEAPAPATFDTLVARTQAALPRVELAAHSESSVPILIEQPAQQSGIQLTYLTPPAHAGEPDAAGVPKPSPINTERRYLKSTANGSVFQITVSEDGSELREHSVFDPGSWPGAIDASGTQTAWQIGAYRMTGPADTRTVFLGKESGPDGDNDVAVVSLAFLGKSPRALKAVDGVGAMIIGRSLDGTFNEIGLLDLAQGSPQWRSAAAYVVDDRVVLTVDGYVADLRATDDEHEFAGYEATSAGDFKKCWIWMNQAMAEHLGIG